jgi:hypothetical protein
VLSKLLAVGAVAVACLLAPGVAAAATGSIVFTKDDQLWMTDP